MEQQGLPMSIAVIFVGAILGTMFLVGLVVAAMFAAS